jgi:hypothetical protein
MDGSCRVTPRRRCQTSRRTAGRAGGCFAAGRLLVSLSICSLDLDCNSNRKQGSRKPLTHHQPPTPRDYSASTFAAHPGDAPPMPGAADNEHVPLVIDMGSHWLDSMQVGFFLLGPWLGSSVSSVTHW